MSKEIEGLKNLCRFLAKYQDDLCAVRFKAIKANDPKDYLLMKWPVIQGTFNQINLKKIGQKEIDFDKIHDGVKSMLEDKPKRHPDPNGVLPLTEKELEEFTELFFDNKDIVNRLYYDGNCIVVEWKEPDNNEFGQLYLDEVSAILWLAERFELNGGE